MLKHGKKSGFNKVVLPCRTWAQVTSALDTMNKDVICDHLGSMGSEIFSAMTAAAKRNMGKLEMVHLAVEYLQELDKDSPPTLAPETGKRRTSPNSVSSSSESSSAPTPKFAKLSNIKTDKKTKKEDKKEKKVKKEKGGRLVLPTKKHKKTPRS